MERRSRNTLTIIIIIIIIIIIQTGTLVVTLPGVWRDRVSARTGRPGVSTW